MVGPGSCVRAGRWWHWLVIAVLAVLFLLTNGCFGCLAAWGLGQTYVENRSEFNACFAAAVQVDKGDEIRAILLDGPEGKSLADWQAAAAQLKDWGLEDDCGPAVEVLKESMPEPPDMPDLPDVPVELP